MIGPKRLAVGAAVAAVVLAAVYLFVARDDPPGVEGLAPVGEPAFGDDGAIDGGIRGLYSPDGTRLAVIGPDGLGLAENGEIRPVTEEGSNVVDAAWFRNGSTLLVAEGPVPTGGLAVVDIDGTVRGTVPLEPGVGFGGGHGMSVAPGGRSAVVTAVERPTLDSEQRYLVHVDLETGATRPLTEAGGPDELRPFHLDAGRVAFTERSVAGDTSRALVVDVASGAVTEVAGDAAVAGLIDEELVLLGPEDTLSVDGRALATVPQGAAVTSVHPDGREAVVATTVDTPTGGRVGRLERLELRAARAR